MDNHLTASGYFELREETPEGVLRHWNATCTACGYEMGTTHGATPGYINKTFIVKEMNDHITYMAEAGR